VRILLAALLLALAAPTTSASACTAFHAERGGQHVVGKSYDWHTGEALVVFNAASVAKTAFLGHLADEPATWVSRYGSVTFNQYGPEMPSGGMNEAGLVVEVLWQGEVEYPQPDRRPSVNELQWVQWALDGHATVAELAADAPGLRVSPLYGMVHYFACDATGDCGAFEYVNGALVIVRGRSMKLQVLTNDRYADSLAYARQFEGLGGELSLPYSSESLDRFATAAWHVDHGSRGAGPVDEAFAILDEVAMGPFSKWAIVYQPEQRQIWFRTAASRELKRIDLDRLDIDCADPLQVMDIDSHRGGDASTRFRVSTRRLWKGLLATTLEEFDNGVYFDEMVKAVVRYPETLGCAEP
jgi:penicillin V acylase-like amidase (Ntn superfamily)